MPNSDDNPSQRLVRDDCPVILDIQDKNRVKRLSVLMCTRNDRQLIYSHKTIYKKFYKIFEPTVPIDLKVASNSRKAIPGKSSEDSLERSIRRSKRNIKDYIFNNEFEWFVNITF